MFSTPTTTRCSSRAAVVVGGWRAPLVPSLRHSGDVHPASTAGAFYSTGAAHSGVHSKSSASLSQGSTSAARLMSVVSRAATAADAHSDVLFCVVMSHIFWLPQRVTQPVNGSLFTIGAQMYQSEIAIPRLVKNPSWVAAETVNNWKTWREATLWCWENRPDRGMNEIGDQATFRLLCVRAYKVNVHAPHVSRWVNPHTKAPMDLPPDLVSAFEEFTGWHGMTQFFNRKAKTTCLEEMQHRIAA